jgi:hypothetical protein
MADRKLSKDGDSRRSDRKASAASALQSVMPEACALRQFNWQLFATFTFRSENWRPDQRKTALFTWLRYVAHCGRIHFVTRLLWFARYERGLIAGRGHFHCCVSGLPRHALSNLYLHNYMRHWRKIAGIGRVEPYDRARDGVGYVLKTRGGSYDNVVGDDHAPILSDSLFEALRRGPM